MRLRESGLRRADRAEAFFLDARPSAPSTYDDEFDGSTLDAKWTSPITSNAGNETTATVANGIVSIEPTTAGTASTARRCFGIRQPSPAGSFVIKAKISTNELGSSDGRDGLFVATTAGKAHVMGLYSHGLTTRVANYIGVTTYSESADWSGFDGTSTDLSRAIEPAWRWMRMDWNSGTSTLTCYYSIDGFNWLLLTSRAALTQPDRMGLAIYSNSAVTSADHALMAGWFRAEVT